MRRSALSIFCNCICLRRAVSCAICWACRASMRDRRPTIDWSSATVPAASLFVLLTCSISPLWDINACRKASSWSCSIYVNLLAWLIKIYHEYPVAAHYSSPFMISPQNSRADILQDLGKSMGHNRGITVQSLRGIERPNIIFFTITTIVNGASSRSELQRHA
jgi:hypothetical protein